MSRAQPWREGYNLASDLPKLLSRRQLLSWLLLLPDLDRFPPQPRLLLRHQFLLDRDLDPTQVPVPAPVSASALALAPQLSRPRLLP